MSDHELSVAIEELLVARNPRQMQVARAALAPGYYCRAAQLLRGVTGQVLIGTGFPVGETFETDGPVGAIALYRALEGLGAKPLLACGAPLSAVLAGDFRVLELAARELAAAQAGARQQLATLRPAAVLAIECPGLAADQRYYNMRGEDITARCAFFDPFLEAAQCPTIAIGDGGNEAGMGKIAAAIAGLDIRAAITGCDELLVADVSNWGAYGLIALLGRWAGRDLLAEFSPLAALRYLSERGSVDGVTRQNTLTEDGLQPTECLAVIREMRTLTGFAPR